MAASKTNNTNNQDCVMVDILKYLEQQHIIGGEDFDNREYGIKRARSVLSEIIHKIENRAKLIDAFEAAMKTHNQYLLFDFGTIVKDFVIDDDLYEKMTFRESLLVSTFLEREKLPMPVGGLCVDVQKAKGRNTFVRRDPKFEHELMEALTWKQEIGNVKNKGNWTESCKDCDENKSEAKHKSLKQKSCPNSESNAEDQKLSSEPSVKVMEPTPSQLKLLEYELGIKDNLKRTQCKFLIHISCQFNVNGMNAGSSITSWVDKNFHTLEEKRTEFLVEKDGTVKERKLFLVMQKGKYYVKSQSTIDDSIERKFYSFKLVKNYISEGASCVLMRYLSLKEYEGEFELSTMYINGNMCRNIYRCTGPELALINNNKVKVCKIYRTIIEECGITHNSVTVLSSNGRIIKQEWQQCDYILQLNPFEDTKYDQKPGKLEKIHLKHVWENDMFLFSKYVDRKERNHLKLKKYIKDHPELKNIIKDYLGKIVLMKPAKVVDFTINHFMQYAPVFLPKDEYFVEEEEEKESVFYREVSEESSFAMPEEDKIQEEHIKAIQYLMSMSDVSCACEGICACSEITPIQSSLICICEDPCECQGETDESEQDALLEEKYELQSEEEHITDVNQQLDKKMSSSKEINII